MVFAISSFLLLCFFAFYNIGIFFDIVHENPIMSMCWVDIDISGSFGLRSLLL
jgi:hypothetical protein